jgi:Uma2 family endonuclease
MGETLMQDPYILSDVFRLNPDYVIVPRVSFRCEIFNGRIIPVPAITHQVISLRIASALLQYAESSRLGRVLPAPCKVILSEKIVMQPDVLFIRNERRGLIGRRGLRGAPDLVVEVLSPATRQEDLKVKKRIYEQYAVQEYWLVDPDHARIETMIWSELGYISAVTADRSASLSSPLLPDLNLDLSSVFETDDD